MLVVDQLPLWTDGTRPSSNHITCQGTWHCSNPIFVLLRREQEILPRWYHGVEHEVDGALPEMLTSGTIDITAKMFHQGSLDRRPTYW